LLPRGVADAPTRPTAIFCDDDILAAMVYKAALGMACAPGRLSVVGLRRSELARMLEPELTTVSLPAERIGDRLMRHDLQLRSRQTQLTSVSMALTADTLGW